MSNWDITLDGAGYMLVPKSYRATADDDERGRVERHAVGVAGLTRSTGVWPAQPPSHGLGPAFGFAAESGIASATVRATAFDDAWLYVVSGANLYRWSRVSGVAPVLRRALAAAAVDLALVGTTLYVAFGSGTPIASFVDSTGAYTAAPFASSNTADLLLAYGSWLVHTNAAAPAQLVWRYGSGLTSLVTVDVDSPVRALVPYDAGFLVVTDTSVYYARADHAAGPPSYTITTLGAAQPQTTSDLRHAATFRGQVYAWLGGEVVVWDEGERAWQPAGRRGAACSGIAVAGRSLTVSLIALDTGLYELWCFDGAHWWLVDQSSTAHWRDIAPDGLGRLAAFRASDGGWRLYDPDSIAHTALVSTATIVTDPLDAGAPEHPKRWSTIGLQLRRDDTQSVGSWTCQLAWSADGGATWTNASAAQVVDRRQQTVTANVDVTAVTLLLRATLTKASGLAPFVVLAFADARVLSDRARKRRWQFQVRAADHLADRDGAADPRTGQTIRAALWSLWEAAASVTFRDVDYAATAQAYTVRLTTLTEDWPNPADHPALGPQTVLAITLVEP